MTTFYTYMESPIGILLLTSNGAALTGVWMLDNIGDADIKPCWVETSSAEPFSETIKQLCDYFDGKLTEFSLPLAMTGTEFQVNVWNYLKTIPYGVTKSYGQIAAALSQPGASRAVGLANGQNPIGIIVPCHRVIGSNGRLTGYAGGSYRKQYLLELEKQTIAKLGLAPQLSLL